MEPFKIVIELKTGILVPSNPICLDAILASLIDGGTNNFDDTMQLMDEALYKTDGVYHASSLIFGIEKNSPLIADETICVKLTRPDSDLCPSTYLPDGKSGKYSKKNIHSGLHKNSINKHRTLWSPYIIFYGMGDIEKVQDYLEFCLIGIGRNSSRKGSGSVGRIMIEEIDEDLSFLNENRDPNRPLPEALYKKMTIANDWELSPYVRARIPYFDQSTEELGVSPAEIRTELLNNPFLTI